MFTDNAAFYQYPAFGAVTLRSAVNDRDTEGYAG
jgi:hypothetical protein